uniref:Putative plant transposon protein domain-containing protein n=1 Tax=Solanum tuberosum TaxID=4113 RepID=M1DXX6_SOLTU
MNNRRAESPVGVSPNRSASPSWTTVGTTKIVWRFCKTQRAKVPVGDSPNRLASPTVKLSELRPKVAESDQLPKKWAREIVIDEEAAASRLRLQSYLQKEVKARAEGLRTTLEEKQLSTDGVVDKYPEVWNTLKFHNFEVFTKPRGPYIPTLVGEFYAEYGELVSKGKKKASAFKPANFVMVRGKKVNCSSSYINVVLGCSRDFMHDYIDLVKKKTLDDIKGWLAPLLSDVSPRWIEAGAQIEKKGLKYSCPVEYMRDDADRKREAPADTSSEVDVDMLSTEAIMPPHTTESTDLEDAMAETVVQAWHRETSMVGSSIAKDVVRSGTDAQTKGVAAMQTSPEA